ncbi:MAG: hypothetical protein SFH39_01155 [Candidatus Magnetobacterium sp. LHC-1]
MQVLIEKRLDRLERLLEETVQLNNSIAQELRAAISGLAAQNAERDRQDAERERLNLERDRQNAERERLNLERDQQNLERDRENAKRDRENAEKAQRDKEENDAFHREMRAKELELSAQLSQMSKDFQRELNQTIGNVANRLGTIVEDIIAPGVAPVIRKYFNCEPVDIRPRTKKRKNGHTCEVDLLLICPDMVFMIEVKATPRTEDVKNILAKANRLTSYFPECSGMPVIPFLGSIVIDDHVINYASKKGLYTIAFRDWLYLDILNFEETNKVNTATNQS